VLKELVGPSQNQENKEMVKNVAVAQDVSGALSNFAKVVANTTVQGREELSVASDLQRALQDGTVQVFKLFRAQK